MVTPFDREKQDRVLKTIEVALDNFTLAYRVADLLNDYGHGEPPRTTLYLTGKRGEVTVSSSSCGLFTTPVIQSAILDTRRSLEFFGISRDRKANVLKPKPINGRYDDDLSIEHLGLPLITPEQLLKAVFDVTSRPMEPLFVEVLHWSEKKLAHFTDSDPNVKFGAISDVSRGMIQAYFRLVYDASGRNRPGIRPE